MNIVLVIAVLILVILWVIVRKREAKAQSRVAKEKTVSEIRSEVARKSTPYHAVSIKFGDNACRAAKDLAGKRFLSGAAPRLPLPDCNVLECKCRFVHHSDRRSGADRRSQFQGSIRLDQTGAFEKERRNQTERRKPDKDNDDFF